MFRPALSILRLKYPGLVTLPLPLTDQELVKQVGEYLSACFDVVRQKATLPLLLLIASSMYGAGSRDLENEQWRYRLEQEVIQIGHLDSEYRAMQRALSLLKGEEERSFTMPVIALYQQTPERSAQEELHAARETVYSLREAINTLRTRFIPFGTKAIAIDLSHQRASLIEEGRIVAQYPVSSGMWGTPTPRGTFQVYRKQSLRVSSLETPYRMPFYMAFTPSGSHGMHALPYLGKSPERSNYWQEARTHIGIPVSHGCVRFLPEDAEKVYEWTEVGTQVLINV